MGINSQDRSVDDDISVDFLDDDYMESERETVAAKPSSSCDVRRKIEERLERRRMIEELGLGEDSLDW